MSEVSTGTDWLKQALGSFTEDDPEYHLILAQLFFLLAHRAQERADLIRRRGRPGSM